MHRNKFALAILSFAAAMSLTACGESDHDKIRRLEKELAVQQGMNQGMIQQGQIMASDNPAVVAPQIAAPQIAAPQMVGGVAPQPIVINNQPPAQIAHSTGIDAGDVMALTALGLTAGLLAHQVMQPRSYYPSQMAYDNAYREMELNNRRIDERNRRYAAEARARAARSENRELRARLAEAEKASKNPQMMQQPIKQVVAQTPGVVPTATPKVPAPMRGNITQNTQTIQAQPQGGLFKQQQPANPTQPYQQAQPQQSRPSFSNQQVQQVQPQQSRPSGLFSGSSNSSRSSSGSSSSSFGSSSRSSSSGRGR